MTTELLINEVPSESAGLDPKRYWALAVIGIAQLMIVLDASVVIVALPSAQHALHISIANRQWVMSAYTLVFGSLLLLGGRVADYLGRRRVFIIGLIGLRSGLRSGRPRAELKPCSSARERCRAASPPSWRRRRCPC